MQTKKHLLLVGDTIISFRRVLHRSNVYGRMWGCDIICKKQRHYDNGDICAVIYDDQTTLKRVRFLTNEVELVPCNHNYETVKVNSENFRIEGKIVCTFH